MFRIGTLLPLAIVLVAFAALTNANPPNEKESKFEKALSVQAAIARARTLLAEKQANKAVDVLEEQLPKVNGNNEFLLLLRDAYRIYIKDLLVAGHNDHAKRYLDRLCILDPSAAKDPSLQPAAKAPPYKFEQPAAKQTKLSFPNFTMPKLPNPFARKEAPKPAEPIVRGVPQSDATEDPFDAKNRRDLPSDADKSAKARELVTRGANEFRNERYAQARMYFEQAFHADGSALDTFREQWAYCIIKGVSDSMDQPNVKVSDLQKQVDSAIQMAPNKVMVVGQQVLTQLDQRAKAPQLVASVAKVRHWGQNKEGWQVAETQHYRIFHKKDTEFAERVAQIAENTRTTMYRKWFGVETVEWNPTCELILHVDSNAYTQMTGVPGNSPGHSRIESDPSGRVVARRLDLRMDANGWMEAVLPHEATHVVLAGMFGSTNVPRWCDEGIAVLSEPDEKIDKHRRNLLKHLKDGELFGLRELMELKDYPHPRRIGAFYAQSVVMTEFLVQQKNPRTLAEFIKDGVRYGYEVSLQKHYGMTFAQLEQLWQQQVLSDTERYAARK